MKPRPLAHRIVSLWLAALVLTASVGLTVERHTCRFSGRSRASRVLLGPTPRGCYGATTPPRLKDMELGEVTVTTRAPAYSASTPTNTQVISARDLTKPICCNLAESFETNAAVEVTTSDAVSGAKQIQLLGLDGAYSLLTVDNQPALRGLAAPYRLGYLAGPWVENIEIIKGTGSVVNGYEAISGQINVKLKEPEKTDQLLFNAYANDLGKFDVNLNTSARLNPKWSTVLLLHTDHLGRRVDRNSDGFLDLHEDRQGGQRVSGPTRPIPTARPTAPPTPPAATRPSSKRRTPGPPARSKAWAC